MCTAISVTVGDTYFGRNLDYEHNFGEKITITPRNYSFTFRNGKNVRSHYAIIGMALPYNGYPLYFDGTNEAGLSIAGLNFPFYAKYNDKAYGKENICSFEFIPYILSECKSVSEAKECLKNINITNEAFSSDVKPTQLHWIIGDRCETITAEQTSDGLRVYKNPVGVLTNSPTFDIQMFNQSRFLRGQNSIHNTVSYFVYIGVVCSSFWTLSIATFSSAQFSSAALANLSCLLSTEFVI